jgi:(p)ppGpp synthase/HD superfamily hydrolase
VLNCLSNWGLADDATWAIAMLHDVNEETEEAGRELNDWLARFTDLAAQYGLRDQASFVARVVADELTFIPGNGRFPNKDAYLASFRKASVQALVVKVADRLCNSWSFYYAYMANPNRRTEDNYAPKYFDKAGIVGKSLLDRKDEIVECYGDHVWQQAMADWEETTSAIRK